MSSRTSFTAPTTASSTPCGISYEMSMKALYEKVTQARDSYPTVAGWEVLTCRLVKCGASPGRRRRSAKLNPWGPREDSVWAELRLGLARTFAGSSPGPPRQETRRSKVVRQINSATRRFTILRIPRRATASGRRQKRTKPTKRPLPKLCGS
jgi:hypothetical protein